MEEEEGSREARRGSSLERGPHLEGAAAKVHLVDCLCDDLGAIPHRLLPEVVREIEAQDRLDEPREVLWGEAKCEGDERVRGGGGNWEGAERIGARRSGARGAAEMLISFVTVPSFEFDALTDEPPRLT